MTELYEVLDIIRTILEALCQRDATLLTADIAVKFALKKLSTINNSIAAKMLTMLKNRYRQRRLPETSILTYLQNPEMYFSNAHDEDWSVFTRPSSDEICRKIVELLRRTLGDSFFQTAQLPSDTDEEIESEPQSKKEELNAELKKATACKRTRMTHSDSQ